MCGICCVGMAVFFGLFIFECMPVIQSICDMKSFCVIYMSLVIYRWNIISEGYVFTNVCVYVCIVCDYYVLRHIALICSMGVDYKVQECAIMNCETVR